VKPNETWKVIDHGKLEKLADNLHSVTGKLPMPLGETVRRMTIAKLADGRLIVFSAIALDETEMAKVDALGRVAFLIVPSGIHRMDIKGWKQRYPHAHVIAPKGVREKVEELVKVDAIDLELDDPRVRLEVVPGTGEQELAMLVTTDGGSKTLVIADLIFNLPEMHGFDKLKMTLMGFGPGHPTQPRLVMMKLVKDKDAMRAQLLAWANDAGIERILVSHGLPIENPREALLELAA
jgi:hypothetical protein